MVVVVVVATAGVAIAARLATDNVDDLSRISPQLLHSYASMPHSLPTSLKASCDCVVSIGEMGTVRNK